MIQYTNQISFLIGKDKKTIGFGKNVMYLNNILPIQKTNMPQNLWNKLGNSDHGVADNNVACQAMAQFNGNDNCKATTWEI